MKVEPSQQSTEVMQIHSDENISQRYQVSRQTADAFIIFSETLLNSEITHVLVIDGFCYRVCVMARLC